ncbi:SDR family oxidoreductase [Micromonospora sp. NPDC049559]|uniref:SDR family oxidoreductase n=1 Tax=Micromonospora sp. NPDC049559 TaxID=3155923 RepID=UPI00343C9F98
MRASDQHRFDDQRFDDQRIVITSAGRDFGRSVALRFAEWGAEVHLSARRLAEAERTRREIRDRGYERVHAYACDLTDPVAIRAFAAAVAERTERVDILVNNGSRYLDGPGLAQPGATGPGLDRTGADLAPTGTGPRSASDGDIIDTIASGATGTVLVVKHFLPLLRRSAGPDVVTMVSACGVPGHDRSGAHEAFYAAKSAQGGFVRILSRRLRPEGIRVISLYPPDFANPDPFSPGWDRAPRGADDPLTANSLVDCVRFALGQPRDCFISEFHFEQVAPAP